MDYLIIFIATVAGLAFHAWLYLRIRRWTDRDLALSLAGNDPGKRAYALEKLAEAKAKRIKRKDLEAWLTQALLQYQPPEQS